MSLIYSDASPEVIGLTEEVIEEYEHDMQSMLQPLKTYGNIWINVFFYSVSPSSIIKT